MPAEIIGLDREQVTIVWENGDEDSWPARDLRLQCACALCQSEATGERILDPTTVPDGLAVTHMELIGNYGLNIHFSDGHTTGIYRFSELASSQSS